MVDWDGLENRCAARYRGFESHPLLQKPQGGFQISPCVAAQQANRSGQIATGFLMALRRPKPWPPAVSRAREPGWASGGEIDADIGGAVADDADGAPGIGQRNFGPRSPAFAWQAAEQYKGGEAPRRQPAAHLIACLVDEDPRWSRQA